MIEKTKYEKKRRRKLIERKAELTMILHHMGRANISKEVLVQLFEAEYELNQVLGELND